MMLFPPREAMTTAEPPEPLTFRHSEIFIFKQILQRIVGPAARHSVYSVCSVDSNMLFFRAFRAFRGSNLCLGCGLTAPDNPCDLWFP